MHVLRCLQGRKRQFDGSLRQTQHSDTPKGVWASVLLSLFWLLLLGELDAAGAAGSRSFVNSAYKSDPTANSAPAAIAPTATSCDRVLRPLFLFLSSGILFLSLDFISTGTNRLRSRRRN